MFAAHGGRATKLANDLKAFYKLDEASGNAVDVVSGYDLTDNNTVTSATGVIGNARSFDDANTEYLSVSSNSDFSTGDVAFFISLWVYLDDVASSYSFVSKWNSSSNSREYDIQYNQPSNVFRFRISDNGTGGGNVHEVEATSFGGPSTSTWTFVCAWHDPDANTINIQINDGTVDSTSHSGGVHAGSADFQIGRLASGGAEYDGRIDSVGFWRRIPDAQERALLYNNGNGAEFPF